MDIGENGRHGALAANHVMRDRRNEPVNAMIHPQRMEELIVVALQMIYLHVRLDPARWIQIIASLSWDIAHGQMRRPLTN